MAARVIIKKQQIHIRTPDAGLAFQIRKQMTDALQYELIEMLDRVFSRLTIPENAYINIDKLSVDLGTLSQNDFEKHFLTYLEPKLSYELQENLNKNIGAEYQQPFQNAYPENPHQPSPVSVREQQELTALLYFLSFGLYPWWYKKEIRKTPGHLLKDLTGYERETLVLKILSLKKRGSDEEVNRMISRLFTHLPQERYGDMIDHLLSLYNNPGLSENIDVLEKNKTELRKSLSLSETEFYSMLFSFLLLENTDERNIIHKFLVQIKEENLKDKNFTTKENDGPSKKQAQRDKETEAEGIYIGNAGLVLLHPFLTAFYNGLGLLDQQNRFISTAASQKAAVLLYYLQCGSERYREWEMTLNKIFCGIGSTELIPDGIPITENEKEECLFLLQTIVNYWEVLKGASTESLQNTFILREGKITWLEDRWLVQVERTGVDILLERLPWSYATIKFPWLDHIIYTEW